MSEIIRGNWNSPESKDSEFVYIVGLDDNEPNYKPSGDKPKGGYATDIANDWENGYTEDYNPAIRNIPNIDS